MSTRGLRERMRDELIREIKDAARRQLAEHGANALSVRAIMRELDMASSAVYRYFPSRDALLTALIEDAYRGLGAAARQADGRVAHGAHLERWIAVFRAVRDWARANPHEYGLIYGTPVPGYAAPPDTTAPASEVVLLLAQIVADAAPHRTGRHAAHPNDDLTGPLAADVDELRQIVRKLAGPEVAERLEQEDASAVLHVLDAWTTLFGTVSFEVFGHYDGVLDAREDYLDRLARKTAAPLGLT